MDQQKFQEQIGALNGEAARHTRAMLALSARPGELRARLTDSEQQLQGAYDQSVLKLMELPTAFGQVANQVSERRDQLRGKVSQLSDRLEGLGGRLQASLEQLRQELSGLERQAQRLESQLDSAGKSLERGLAQRKEGFGQALSELEETHQALQASYKDTEAGVKALSELMKKCQAAAQKEQQSLHEGLSQARSDVSGQLSEFDSRMGRASQSFEGGLRDQKQTLAGRLNSLREQGEGLHQELASRTGRASESFREGTLDPLHRSLEQGTQTLQERSGQLRSRLDQLEGSGLGSRVDQASEEVRRVGGSRVAREMDRAQEQASFPSAASESLLHKDRMIHASDESILKKRGASFTGEAVSLEQMTQQVNQDWEGTRQ